MENYKILLFYLKVTLVLFLSAKSVAKIESSSIEGSADKPITETADNNESGYSKITSTPNNRPDITTPDYYTITSDIESYNHTSTSKATNNNDSNPHTTQTSTKNNQLVSIPKHTNIHDDGLAMNAKSIENSSFEGSADKPIAETADYNEFGYLKITSTPNNRPNITTPDYYTITSDIESYNHTSTSKNTNNNDSNLHKTQTSTKTNQSVNISKHTNIYDDGQAMNAKSIENSSVEGSVDKPIAETADNNESGCLKITSTPNNRPNITTPDYYTITSDIESYNHTTTGKTTNNNDSNLHATLTPTTYDQLIDIPKQSNIFDDGLTTTTS